jgi:hypothetical protein
MTTNTPPQTTSLTDQMASASVYREELLKQLNAAMLTIVAEHQRVFTHLLDTAQSEQANALMAAHQEAIDVETVTKQLAQQAAYFESVARDLLTESLNIAQERDRIVEAVRNSDQLERLHNIGNLIQQIAEEHFAYGSDAEFDAIFENLADAGLNNSDLADWIANGYDRAYSRTEWLALAADADQLAAYFRQQAEQGS